MNIFAAIKKAINSNLDKPLDTTLNEIQATVNNVRKATRHVETIVGIPYHTTYNAQVISENDTPVFSVEGCGRIFQILPVSNVSNSSRLGTVYLTVDGEITLNNRVSYGYPASDTNGIVLINDHYATTVAASTTIFDTPNTFYFTGTTMLRGDPSTFDSRSCSIISPNGVPFKNGFDIRLTQAVGTTANEKTGVIVVYELYE